MRKTLLIASLLIFFFIPGCESGKKKEKVPTKTKPNSSLALFDLSKPEKFNMPESLQEISGIAFHDEKSDTIYAVNDEEGKVFRLGWNVPRQLHSKFGKQGDYEDVSIANGNIFVLKSNGNLFTFPFSDAIYAEIDQVREIKALLPKGEYEGMFADQLNNQLYVLCKKCDADYSWNTTSGYVIELGDSLSVSSQFQIDVAGIKEYKGKVKEGFRPSGLAKNPIFEEWFIISASNKLLIVTDLKWKIKEAFPLTGNLFNQPEGIAFDKTGNLYISNEGDDLTLGNILKFERKPE